MHDQLVTEAVVDGRNVMRSRWPNLEERELVDLCDEWARERDLHARVVFDGRALGERDTVEVSATCTVEPVVGRSADDWISEHAARLAERDQPFLLVTSDRGLRERAAGGAREVIGGGRFLTMLGR